MSAQLEQQARDLFAKTFHHEATDSLQVPGRVNLIGEHIDYHSLPVMPIAIQKHIAIAFERAEDRELHVVSATHGERRFAWEGRLDPSAPGDFENYIKAAAQAVSDKWHPAFGIRAAISADLPAAAGLSSSSALLVAMTLALLRANGMSPSFAELMEVLPDAEYFVGTRGGGMDHAAVLGSEPGAALFIEFAPFAATPVAIPPDWSFVIAHSMTSAEKSGASREEYNARRVAGARALQKMSLDSYRTAVNDEAIETMRTAADTLDATELDSFMHVVTEAGRVKQAVTAFAAEDADTFGRLLVESHASLRDRLRVSTPALDAVVTAAMESGALGARLTGAGFGGYAVAFTKRDNVGQLRRGIIDRFYAGKPEFDESQHLITVEPSAGALHA